MKLLLILHVCFLTLIAYPQSNTGTLTLRKEKPQEFKETAVEFDTVSWESVDETQVFTIVENMPQFKGGPDALSKYLNKNIKYPTSAKAQNISGTVYVRFTINENGSISDATVIRGSDPLLNAEAIRVVQTMPDWKPGSQRGKAVKVSYTLPIRFYLK